jgi:hypothetical protein
VTEHDLKCSVLELLTLAFRTAEDGEFAAANSLASKAAQCFEEANVIAFFLHQQYDVSTIEVFRLDCIPKTKGQ